MTTINSIDKISPFGTVEIGGRNYKTVKIGNQEWMAENLDYQYSDIVIGDTVSQTEPRGNYYNNDSATYDYDGNKYGLLYNIPAAFRLSNQLPTGWALPSLTDFQTLISFIGGTRAGTKLQNTSWNNGTDEYGFNALPAGMRSDGGSFSAAGNTTFYWTQSNRDGGYYYCRIYNDGSMSTAYELPYYNRKQYSIRFVKNL